MRHTNSGIKQTQIVINFRYGTHSGTRVMTGCFLVDGNSGRKPINLVNIRLFHLTQKLSGIRGQRFHISALSFRVKGIKGKGAFPGAADTCKDHQFISGNGQIYIFQVVLSGTPDDDFIFHILSFFPL